MTREQDWESLLRQEPPRVVPSGLRDLVLRGQRRWQVSLAILTLICGLTFVAFFPWSIVNDVRLDLGATVTRGVVLESIYAKRTFGDDAIQRKLLVFSVRFRFEDLDGLEHVVTSLAFGHIPPGTESEVEFLPTNPGVARLRGGFYEPGGLWEVSWNVTFVALPLVGIWNFHRWRNRRLSLLSHGVVAVGGIDRVRRDQPEDDRCGWAEVRYGVSSSSVIVLKAVEAEIYERACALAERRVPVRVLYLPRALRDPLIIELT
ncbi:MAG: hypothetical protein AAF637_19115 [Pseudomonadota bacterium]